MKILIRLRCGGLDNLSHGTSSMLQHTEPVPCYGVLVRNVDSGTRMVQGEFFARQSKVASFPQLPVSQPIISANIHKMSLGPHRWCSRIFRRPVPRASLRYALGSHRAVPLGLLGWSPHPPSHCCRISNATASFLDLLTPSLSSFHPYRRGESPRRRRWHA